MAHILIVDDDDAMRESLAETISELGHVPVEARNGEEAVGKAMDVEAVILDLRMPGRTDGMEVLRRLREQSAAPSVAVLTAFASAENTIEAMRLGAFDHLTKPIRRDELAELVARMLSTPRRIATVSHQSPPSDEIIGVSPAIRKVQKSIGLAADSDATVLISGETGTGKELVARALHRHGRRRTGPFVPVNCAAIPADLLESELFGHVRGSFTGAIADRLGAFREADGGTLFLDEIGDMSLPMQAKILRALQDRTVTPVGGKAQKCDVRLIAATHRDLPEAVAAGTFRQDLFYRLNVIPIAMPPLRDRPEDIPTLARHFLELATGGVKKFSDSAEALLKRHHWPGNVRELKNIVERAATMARADILQPGDFVFESEGQARREDWLAGDMPTAVARLEREMISRALHSAGGNRAEAARILGIQRQLLYTKMDRYGLTGLS